MQVAGDIEHLLATHHRLTGPRREPDTLPGTSRSSRSSHTDRQSTYLVRTEAPILDPAWEVSTLTLEDLVLAYMSGADRRDSATRPGGAPMIWLTWRQFRVSGLVLLGALAAGIVVLAVTGPSSQTCGRTPARASSTGWPTTRSRR